MRRIITISRQFGSGGRELGKRLADHLGIAYYDREIITEIAARSGMAVQYVDSIIEHRPMLAYPITIERTFDFMADLRENPQFKVLAEQHTIIEEMARKSDCVIIGRCADYILRNENPFTVFVHADIESRMQRCRIREQGDHKLSDDELKSSILKVDKHRAKYHAFFTDRKWGERENYSLCINTTGLQIDKLSLAFAQYLKELG